MKNIHGERDEDFSPSHNLDFNPGMSDRDVAAFLRGHAAHAARPCFVVCPCGGKFLYMPNVAVKCPRCGTGKSRQTKRPI